MENIRIGGANLNVKAISCIFQPPKVTRSHPTNSISSRDCNKPGCKQPFRTKGLIRNWPRSGSWQASPFPGQDSNLSDWFWLNIELPAWWKKIDWNREREETRNPSRITLPICLHRGSLLTFFFFSIFFRWIEFLSYFFFLM